MGIKFSLMFFGIKFILSFFISMRVNVINCYLVFRLFFGWFYIYILSIEIRERKSELLENSVVLMRIKNCKIFNLLFVLI